MHRIDTKTAQKDKFGAGKNGFTRGNPQTGTPATDLDDDYFDMLQEELCSVVEASGASLEKGRHDQLLTALRALLLSRKNPFGDIKSDGTVQTALENLGLGEGAKLMQQRLLRTPRFHSYTGYDGGIEQSVIIQWGWNAAKASASGGMEIQLYSRLRLIMPVLPLLQIMTMSAHLSMQWQRGIYNHFVLLRCAAQTGSYYYNWIAIGY
ncbi:Uncharacterised protein [Escherichia coli]|nr:Uncharacterised protein [Escherichia coli]